MKRRTFLKNSAGFAGMALSGLAINPAEAASRPSNLKITDIRGCTIATNYDYPIIKVYTNQDVYGLGEVRDSGWLGQALIYKPHIVGRDPLNIEGILRNIKPLSGHARVGGGYSAIDMALCDIAGKVLGIPAYRLLGSKRRNRIPMYCDTTGHPDPKIYGERMKKRLDMGFRNFKMDLYKSMIQKKPGAVAGESPTDKGLEYWGEYVAAVRDAIGWEYPLGSDHYGYLTVDDGIRLGKAMEKYSMAYIEDVIHYTRPNSVYLNKMITDNSPTPTLNGEDIFGVEGFRPWIENNAIDIIHPDIETSGGIIETKMIADLANSYGVRVMFHQAGSPIGCIAGVHCASLVDDFISMENHAVDIPWWGDLVTGVPKPIVNKGYIEVPESPGLGIELNDDAMKEHLRTPGYFEPTPQFDQTIVGHFHIGGPYPHLDAEGKLVNQVGD